jgi:hypothetical protein
MEDPLVDRRKFLGTLAGGLLAAPLAAEAQEGGKTWQIGLLAGGARPPDGAPPLALPRALQELGYVERQNVITWAGGPTPNRIGSPGWLPNSLGSKFT